ncbi:TPA: hypothetical protein NPP16_001303 [Klebsiella pneumoniae]|nr:hypothetical protein [Klebsiella pneumoniae]
MTTIIRNKDVVISNPQLNPIYTPFVAEPGLLAAWRFGDGMTDLSGNGHTLSAVGTPTRGNYYITGDKNNGYLTSVPDGLQRTLVAVWRNNTTATNFGYPVGNLSQSATNTGVGVGLYSSSSSTLNRNSGAVGNTLKTDGLLARALGPDESYASRMNFRFAAFSVDGAGNAANLYIPAANSSLIPATLASGVNLASRSILEDGLSSFYRLINWRDPSTPDSTETALDVAEVLIFDRPLDLEALQRTYLRSQNYISGYGQTI